MNAAASLNTSPSRPGVIVLLSGGLDSATVLAMALEACRKGSSARCIALTIDYGQRHRQELGAAAEIARALGVTEHLIQPLDMRGIGGSALTSSIPVPKDAPDSSSSATSIPVTYVPARNLVFLSIALSLAEARGCEEIWIGVNALDYSGYPDCRPAFIEAFQHTANLATRDGVQAAERGDRNPAFRIIAPIIGMTKAEIIRAGLSLGVDYGRTHSCYDPTQAGEACGQCESCRLRAKGFRDAGVPDPTRYAR